MTTLLSDLLYVVAVILLIGWLVGVFAFNLTGFFHILIVLAVISVLFRLIRGRR